ncbi:hypothetical protein MycrhN_1720 [Mycolicibacterium rhodesiae NBB3]|uniref:Uncharacterized protein n=1 Tax=Mycolicibacterium rhodesiae (strain NBB3) TaxID=710685 RepID=G8RL71_MYCRN|nr:hypothetical protein [Mycolicibacterium rhodesiae]AEV72333.1 hypothetical protein MycrhN_1720 [Mycolicibacterium rhodesiae NBB3]
MSDELLRFVSGPTPYSSWWLWLAVSLSIILIAWYAAVFVFTMPGRRIAGLPVIGAARGELAKRRSIRAVRAIGTRHRAGELGAVPAAAAISRELRAFLQAATGTRAEYMQLDAIAAGELASAAPVLTDLTDAQFNADSVVDVGAAADSAEELIHSWS